MFRDLYAVARHTPLHLIITPNGEQLKIIVTPKPSGDAADNPALAKPFSAIGTPEELDREFPDALKKYAGAVNDLRTALDLPLSELEEAHKKAAKRDEKKADRTRKADEAKKKKEDEAAARKKAREDKAKKDAEARDARNKARRDRATAKKAAKPAPAKIDMPGAAKSVGGKETAWPFPIGSKAPEGSMTAASEPKHRDGLPGKDDCLLEYRNLKRVHGDKLTRRLFIKKAKTGRRYEKLWTNWAKFVKEAEAQLELPIGEHPDVHEETDADRLLKQNPAAAVAGAAAEKTPGGASTEPEPAADPAPEKKAEKQFVLVDAADDAVIRTSKYPFVVGEHPEVEVDGEERRYLVERVEGDSAFARQVLRFKKLVLDEAGNPLASTEEVYEVADQVAEIADKEWRVVRIEDNAYIARAAKPRIKGPAAQTSAPVATTE